MLPGGTSRLVGGCTRLGGEFEIDPAWLVDDRTREEGVATGTDFATGRGALSAILGEIAATTHRRTILLPDYVCGSVPSAVSASGFETAYYPVRQDFTVDVPALADECRSSGSDVAGVLFVDYFGMSDCGSWVRQFRESSSGIAIIRDNVQALFESNHPALEDYRFTSLRKWLPCPDGAAAERQDGTRLIASDPEGTFVGMKVAGNLERHMGAVSGESDDQQAYRHLDEGERLLDESLPTTARMSRISSVILGHMNLAQVAERRRANYEVLAEAVARFGLHPLLSPQEGRVPHFMPILVPSRDSLRAMLKSASIYCPVHWPAMTDCAAPDCRTLQAQELSLVIDQRYDRRDMLRQAEVLEESLSALGVVSHG